jgi:arginyl-tRNA synthetase
MLHLSFGSVLGEDRKPFAARKGGAPELTELLDEAAARGLANYEASHAERKAHGHDVPELTDHTKREIAEAVGFGAVKYADLSGNRTSDYIFSYDKMLATEGNTATYMQYAYARCRAVLRKSGQDETTLAVPGSVVLLGERLERQLGLQLLKFEEVLGDVVSKYEPHHIAAYLWDLAKAFSSFYDQCPVLTAPSEELKQSRLNLVLLTGRMIKLALGLLGIRTVERM